MLDQLMIDGWHPARLLSTAGIRGQDEQERRATASLLAVMGAVPDLSHALLAPLGAPKGHVQCFTEVNFVDDEGQRSTPDGAIIVERGKRRWSALVEVKTGKAPLLQDQVTRYVEIARDNGFDAVITISNQITATSKDSPVTIDKRKLSKVDLCHLSWWGILTESIVVHRYRKVSDPDQSWILGELIHYLDADSSGASGFEDMGEAWVSVRDAARTGTLRERDRAVRAVAESWEQFGQYLCLALSQDLGREVTFAGSRKQTSAKRVDMHLQTLASASALDASLKVPDAIGPVEVRAELGTRLVRTSVGVAAPKEGRPLTRINWLLRQLKDAPNDLRIDVGFSGGRETSSELLAAAIDNPKVLLSQVDPRRTPKSFALILTRPMGSKRGKKAGSFVAETRRQAFAFYGDIVQDLKAWQPPAPRLSKEEQVVVGEPTDEQRTSDPGEHLTPHPSATVGFVTHRPESSPSWTSDE
jgi:hypothetical protein